MRLFESENNPSFGSAIKWALAALLGLLASRLFFLTAVMGNYYRDLATSNQVRRERIEAARGIVTDSQGEVIALNIQQDGRVIRHYPEGEIAASVIGFTGMISEDELAECAKAPKSWGVEKCFTNMQVGKIGIEKTYEKALRGRDGERLIEESATGEEIREISRRVAESGDNLKLNISLKSQKAAYYALKKAIENYLKNIHNQKQMT